MNVNTGILKPSFLVLFSFFLVAVQLNANDRIVSINGAVSEIICALDKEKDLVGVDVNSNYPAAWKNWPK
ncbi:hypothetical protein [Haliscomenobacter hydrossis]|uniref:hypothetical protein n=1 Tax=Haliscomenobacter hydrossis TaxID=2350 RepID=UPI0002E62C74|nr:hypothetical protein [Haliscomenobacter hydrossis]